MKLYFANAWVVSVETDDSKPERDMLISRGTPTKVTMKKSESGIELDKPVITGTFEGFGTESHGIPDKVILKKDENTTITIYTDAIENIEFSGEKKLFNDQQKKIERIEKLQKELHSLAMIGVLGQNMMGARDDGGVLEGMVHTIHKVSHAIDDVLEGMSPKKAINKNIFGENVKKEEKD